MNFPPDLPEIIEYATGPVSRYALPRKPVEFVSSSGKTTAAQVCPQIPYGASAWRLTCNHEWRPLSELPKHWLPFLQRARPSVMDPRAAILGHVPSDAILDTPE